MWRLWKFRGYIKIDTWFEEVKIVLFRKVSSMVSVPQIRVSWGKKVSGTSLLQLEYGGNESV